jgi:sterol 3beta-glucosyltransferase
VLLAGRSLGGPLNVLTYTLILPLMTAPYNRMVNTWRQEALELPPRGALASELTRDGKPVPVLYAFSPHVVPVPPDWPATTVVTGYWFLDRPATWQPPRALVDFLEAGPPPVYVGFGSMTAADPAALTRLVIEALRQAGLRGVLAAGWGGLQSGALPGHVFALEAAPHDWLFPRMAAVVHHGGAGTTAAGLRAGRPTIICPFFGDQAFWGERVFALGAGPRPMAQKSLTAERLADALRQAVGEPGYGQRAEALGQRLQAERGVERAVELVSQGSARAAKPRPADPVSVRR